MTVFLTTHYLEEADALCDRLAIIDHGRIVAEGTPEKLKHEIAGDVITLGLGGEVDRALTLLQSQPFVRQAGLEGDGLRLYVDRGDAAMPGRAASARRRRFPIANDRHESAKSGRRLPAANRPFAPRYRK